LGNNGLQGARLPLFPTSSSPLKSIGYIANNFFLSNSVRSRRLGNPDGGQCGDDDSDDSNADYDDERIILRMRMMKMMMVMMMWAEIQMMGLLGRR
jgi:hypothetical protein